MIKRRQKERNNERHNERNNRKTFCQNFAVISSCHAVAWNRLVQPCFTQDSGNKHFHLINDVIFIK